MKTIGLTILAAILTLTLCGQNINVDKYPRNYNINNAVITDKKVVFTGGGLMVGIDSTMTLTFDTPVRCSKVRLFGPCPVGVYKNVSMFMNQSYNMTSASSAIAFYGVAGAGFNFYNESASGYNIKAFCFSVMSGYFRVDSIIFTIDESITMLSEYEAGYEAGYADVDTTTAYNHGFSAGVKSVNTSLYYTNGYNSGRASVDTTAPFNHGVTHGLSLCAASIDTTPIYNHGFSAGIASVDTAICFNNGAASIDTVAIFDNGYMFGQSDCSSTSINQQNSVVINAFPNPTSDYVTIECDNYEHVDIYDIANVLLNTSTDNTVSLADYNNGMYFLRIYNTNKEVGLAKIIRK